MKKQDKFKKVLKKIGIIALTVIFVLFAYIATEYIVGYPMIWIFGAYNFKLPFFSLVFYALRGAALIATLIFLPPLVKKAWKTTREEVGLTGLPTFTDIGLSIIGFVLTILASSVISSIVKNIINMEQCQDIGIDNVYSPTDRVMTFILLTVIVPIVEEFVFRGWLYGKLRSRLSFWPAAIIVSAFFGFMHGQWNVAIIVGIMSLIMCFAREITGTIYAGILIHMLKNGIAFFILYVIQGGAVC